MTGSRLHLVIGPAEHGVVRFGLDLAAAMGDRVVHCRSPRLDLGWTGLQLPVPAVVHLQYTDGVFGPDTAASAAAFSRLCARIRSGTGGLITATLHDLPDPDDETGRYQRRSRSYRQVLAAVDSATVASEHELERVRALFGRDGACPVPVSVVPLPIAEPILRPAHDRPSPRHDVAVFGFIYPGKGHAEALQALHGLPPDITFAALGRPADGHQDLVSQLRVAAQRQGRRFRMDGYIPAHVLTGRLQRVAVPVVPGASVSASGSLNTWISAGRRPLVAAGAYARELASRYPGGLRLYRPGELPQLIAATLADPGLSWIEDPPPPELLAPVVAAAHVAHLGRTAPVLASRWSCVELEITA